MSIIGSLVGLSLFSGCVILVLGWIAGAHGHQLRRMGVFLLCAAFAPSVVVGLLNAAGISFVNAIQDDPITTVLLIAGGSLAAYGLLRLMRKRPDGPRRIAMKRPYSHRGNDDLISMLKERMRDE